MCGINGVFQFQKSGFEITRSYVDKMRDTMIHRGPNGGGTWISKDGHIGLGHRRLSIIDLSTTADQPMINEDESVALVFNGEIYNHQEIRDELNRSFDIKWKTDHSDTEVILRGYEKWGIDVIHKFRGMFAIGLWDNRTKEFWLVRDRIGIKPIYYSIHHGRLVFASEIKALLQDPDQKRAVNERAFYDYLSFLTTPAPDTLFEGISKLPGGHWLRMNMQGETTIQRYWDVWDHTTPLVGVSEDEVADRLLKELQIAVDYRKIADVPVGVFLSGGIDSSTNAALFSQGGKEKVKTFSIGYDADYGTYKNELHYAQQVADLFHTDHHELRLTQKDLLDFLPRMIELQDEPIADPVCVPVYFVSKLARDNDVIVCQVGEGSDELFWGYDSWRVKLKLQEMNDWPIPKFIKRAGLSLMRALGKKDSLQYELLRRGAEDQPVFWGGAEAFTESQKQSVLSPRLKKKFESYTSWEALKPIRKQFEEKAWEKSHLHWMSYLDLNYRLPELLLMRVDKMSMGVSLEGRVPFLDHKFVELALSIPSAMKTKDGVSKYILKKAVRGVIPDEIIDRKKQGFGVPVYEWFFDKLGDQAYKDLKDFCTRTDFLNFERIEQLFEEKKGAQLWYLLNFSMWHKKYIEQKA